MGLVGVVLAGGLSRRMGRDKALLELDGETLVARAVRLLSPVCPEIAIAAAGRELLPRHAHVADGPGVGPAAGILGAARAYPGRPLLVVACDLPDLPSSLLARLAGRDGSPEEAGADWLVPRWAGRLEPLCARYGPRLLAQLDGQVERGEMALQALAATSGGRIRYLEEGELRLYGDPATIFRNLNRPEDLLGRERGAGLTS